MTIQELLNDTAKNAISHGSIPFWSWNDKLNETELRRQIGVMQDLGMSGFFMHARGGLETEYLSDEWFSCVNACVDEAKKRGMEAWSYDENGWPSGFAGGKLLTDKKNLATYLKYEKTNDFPTADNVLAVYTLDGTKLTRVKAPVSGAEYHVVYQAWDDSFIDSLDKTITEKFLQETHEEYKKRVPAEDFGGAMPGFFTDEPQYYRWATVWSDTLPREFADAYGGADIFEGLAALFIEFDGAREFRYDYWKLCHKLFINHWIKPVYDWCEKNGCKVTGHAVEETQLFTQMWCCGGVMPFYEYEHIPGMDYLGRGLSDDAAPKQLGSACAQLGKKKVLSEMFACCGWDVTPRELKRIAELQYAGGVNLMCQHLYAYSIHGQRKRDYPANYSEHLPWQPEMKAFNNYFNNLGYLLSLGNEAVNTLVIHPIHGAYLDYQRTADYKSIEQLENDFHALSNLLSQKQIPYHWGDETMMAKMAKVDGKTLSVGLCSYDFVIVPAVETLDASTVSLLKAFLANGGRVWCYGRVPDRIDGRTADLSFLKSNTTFEEIAAASFSTITAKDGTKFRQMVRDTEAGKLIYAVNLGNADEKNVSLTVPGVKGLCEIDLDTLEAKPVRGKYENGVFTAYADFEPVESHVFVESEEYAPICPCEKKPDGKEITLRGAFTFAELPENQMTLDKYAVSYDGVTFSEPRPIERVRDNLLRERYHGKVWLKAFYTVDRMPDSLRLAVEPLKADYTVNGNPVAPDGAWWLDRSFRTADILPYTKQGENEIVFSFDYYQNEYVYHVLYDNVMESLRNCLVFDTEIECMYLVGHFAVNTPDAFTDDVRGSLTYAGSFSITKQKKEIYAENLVKSGYPFFAGTMKLRTYYTYQPGRATELVIRGRYAVCHVCVNGAEVKTLMFTDHVDLSGFLQVGENEIVLTLTNSNRNLLGPHHGHDPEPYGVGPGTFSMENQWHDGECRAYVDRYAFMRFGIDQIL